MKRMHSKKNVAPKKQKKKNVAPFHNTMEEVEISQFMVFEFPDRVKAHGPPCIEYETSLPPPKPKKPRGSSDAPSNIPSSSSHPPVCVASPTPEPCLPPLPESSTLLLPPSSSSPPTLHLHLDLRSACQHDQPSNCFTNTKPKPYGDYDQSIDRVTPTVAATATANASASQVIANKLQNFVHSSEIIQVVNALLDLKLSLSSAGPT